MKRFKLHQTRLLTAILIFGMVLSACTSYQPIAGNTPESLAAALEEGDRVEITRSDGTVVTFAIDEINAEGIMGDETLVTYDEIAQVQLRQMDEEKVEDVTLAVLSIPVIVLGIGLIALLSYGGGFPGP